MIIKQQKKKDRNIFHLKLQKLTLLDINFKINMINIFKK